MRPVVMLVTGAAGFIGSHLTERLLADGFDVRGVDCFTDYYDEQIKRANIRDSVASTRFELVEADLAVDEIPPLLEGVDVVFHQAAQPGVRLSWADGFTAYSERNILATQRLLDACRSLALDRFVFASSSSVYGNSDHYPTTETDLPRPFSPYGVTKLAAEHLCAAYAENFGLPTVALRYFTVYGPRQRPDMGFHRLINAGLGGPPFPAYGDGSHVRNFTFVSDVVDANVLAAITADIPPGEMLNICGGGEVSMRDAYALVEELVGSPIPREQRPPASGDVNRTGGSYHKAHEVLGWAPAVDLRQGLAHQVEWHRHLVGMPAA